MVEQRESEGLVWLLERALAGGIGTCCFVYVDRSHLRWAEVWKNGISVCIQVPGIIDDFYAIFSIMIFLSDSICYLLLSNLGNFHIRKYGLIYTGPLLFRHQQARKSLINNAPDSFKNNDHQFKTKENYTSLAANFGQDTSTQGDIAT